MLDRFSRPPGGPAFAGHPVVDIRLASNRELPPGTEVRLADAGRPGAVLARIRLPGTVALLDLGQVPFVGGVVLIPDERVPCAAAY
jgi:hypothetical protein